MQKDTRSFAYDAFISYSREDEKEAERLQNDLERYRIPRKVRKSIDDSKHRDDAQKQPETRRPKYFKIFRDKRDLGLGAGTLDDLLRQSLDECRFLILVCSPRSASSDFVNAEVAYFQQTGKADFIIPYIIEGVPNPKDDSQEQCYPETLEQTVLGVTLSDGSREEAKYRIVARLLGMKYTDFFQRHQEAQRRRLAWIAGMATSVLLAVSCLAIWALLAERKATEQRQEAEALIRFLTFDLRDEAFNHIPLKARKRISDQVDAYYEKWGVENKGERFNRAAHLANLAKQKSEQGNIGEAEGLFLESAAVLEELMIDSPDNTHLVATMAGISRGLGSIYTLQGKTDEAALQIIKSVDVSRKLVKAHPDNASFHFLLGESLTSLASVSRAMGERKNAFAAAREAVDVLRQLHVAQPENGQIKVFMAGSLGMMCTEADLRENPFPACEEALELTRQLVEDDPHNVSYASAYCAAYYGLALNSIDRGRLELAYTSTKAVFSHAQKLVQKDPDSILFQSLFGTATVLNGCYSRMLGGAEDRPQEVEKGLAVLMDLEKKDPLNSQIRELRQMAETVAKAWTESNALRNDQPRINKARKALESKPSDKRARLTLASLLSSQAQDYYLKKAYLKSLALSKESQDLYEACSTDFPDDIPAEIGHITVLVILGNDLITLNDYEQAKTHLTKGLEKLNRLKSQGVEYSTLYESYRAVYDAMAFLYGSLGDLKERVRYEELTVELTASAVASDPESTLHVMEHFTALGGLEYTYALSGELDKAFSTSREALAVTRRLAAKNPALLFGMDRNFLANGLVSLGSHYSMAGEYETARELLDEALDIVKTKASGGRFESAWKSTHANIYRCMTMMYRSMGDEINTLKYAAENEKIILSMTISRLGQLYSYMDSQLAAINILCENGKAEDAEVAYQKVALLIASAPDAMSMAADTRYLLTSMKLHGAWVACLDGRPEAADARIREALSLAGTDLQENHSVNWKQANVRLMLLQGDMALSANKVTEALAYYNNSLGAMRSLLALQPKMVDWRRDMQQVLESYARGMDEAGRASEAESLRKEAAKIRSEGV